MAKIMSVVERSFNGARVMYPVNMSTARKMAVWPFWDSGIDGIMSHAHVTLGANIRLVCCSGCCEGEFLLNWHMMQLDLSVSSFCLTIRVLVKNFR